MLQSTGSQRVGHDCAAKLKMCHAAETKGELFSSETCFGRDLRSLQEYGETLEKV